MPEPQRYAFGPFLLDLHDECLWQDNEVIRLGSRAFAVLRCLVTKAGQLVRKEALLDTVWPEFEVSEVVLTVAIRELRGALGDQARRPRFIETVHGRGYRFIAPIAADATSHQPSPPLPTRTAIFVGRDRESTQLQMWFTTALQGERQVAMIAGEPGIGKTALVDTCVAHLAATAHVWVGHGQCIDHYGAGEAYLPVLEALTRLGRGPGGDQLVTLLRQYAPSWLGQMPTLLSAAAREALGHAMSGVTEARMLRELAEALEVMTAVRPLVLVLEDLHWSDPSTLAFLAYVARRRDWARLLVLGTYRPADVIVQAHPLRRVLAELQQQQQCAHMTLDDLPEAAISAYVRERFGATTVPGGLVRFLHQHSSGNPLFLIAMVDELLRQGVLEEGRAALYVRDELETVTGLVPENLSTLVTQHLEQLSPEDQAILEAASVAGMTFSVAIVAAAVALAASTVEARCATWARQGRFVHAHGIERWPDGTVAARYGFRHALYHEVVLERISAGQRMHLHSCIGRRKETAYADQTQVIAAELAVHFEHAQETHQAVLYRHKAAETALQRSAYTEAIAHLNRGLVLVRTVPDTPERHRRELSLALMLGAALSATRGFGAPEVEHICTQARELAARLGETAQLFIALAGLWRV
jgi:DNA-binding winged helix-turn-helix (wHTH) protein